MSYAYQLPDEDLEAIFRAHIAPGALSEMRPSSTPQLVVLGCQPASGKTCRR